MDRLFGNSVKRIFGLTETTIKEDCRKLHNKELHAVLFKISCDQVKGDERGR